MTDIGTLQAHTERTEHVAELVISENWMHKYLSAAIFEATTFKILLNYHYTTRIVQRNYCCAPFMLLTIYYI